MLIDTDKTSLDLDSILFQAMLDEIVAYVYIKDSHAKYIYVNEGTRQLFQQPLEAILGHADSDFFTGQQLSGLSKNDQRVLLYGEIVRHEELNIPKATGEARIFRTVKKPLFNKQGMILGLIGILTDITDIAQLETTNGLLENALDSEKIKAENQNKRHVQDVAQKNDAIKLAKQSNIAKSQFLATMSHEIRTPLNAFIGSAELLKNTILTPGQSSYVDVAQQSAITVKQVIDDVLNFSKIEAGKVEVAVRETDIIALVDSVVTLMGIQAAKKDLELAVFISDNIPEIVLLDCVKTKQILLNLVSNAIKFTEQGRVEIRLTAEQQ
ncbi:MAG: histidine kinase dimerization/phospho-acceptor domain-containing protein, partial [Methylococcales bacterium]